MKKKLFILFIVAGMITLFFGALGFLQVTSVRNSATKYSKIEGSFDTDDDWWDTLHNHGCMYGERSCYCEKATNVDECVDEYLNNPPEGFDDQLYTFAKNRYVFFVMSIICFIGAWVFHEKKEKKVEEK